MEKKRKLNFHQIQYSLKKKQKKILQVYCKSYYILAHKTSKKQFF